MAQISIIKHFNEVVEDIDITEVLNRIQQHLNPKFFENLRQAYREGREDEYNTAKKGMSAFTVTGTFKGGRKPNLMTSYSGLIILDFDKLGDTLSEVRTAIVADSHTCACFKSPSEDGLKVIVQVATKQEEHATIFNIVADYYSALTGVEADPSGKDITRLCFMSYDPELYSNEQSEPFTLSTQAVSNDHEATFEKCVRLADKKLKFEEGQRNNYVFLLASNCKRLGIPEEAASPLITADYGYDEQEVASSIKSAYSNSPEEYAKFANLTDSTNTESMSLQGIAEELNSTSLIPDSVYANLPRILKDGADVFEDKRQKDVFLTGALSVIGGCMDKVNGVYHQDVLFPNLYVFVVANAASGKGALKYSKILGQALHAYYVKQGHVPPKLLFIPANSSASAVIRHLKESGGKGIIFETEADTLNNSLKQEWGNFSDMLRKAFHHEPISISRTVNEQFYEVNEPRLSIALSGTPNQIIGLIPSAEDGLFSRFIFYAFKGDLDWKDARPSDKVNFDAHFKQLSSKVLEVYQYLSKNPTSFDLTTTQWDEHGRVFAAKLTEITQFVSIDMDSSVKRMGLIMFRIAMILSVLRKAERTDNEVREVSFLAEAESGATADNLVCSDTDFRSAMDLAMTYLEHVVLIFKKMPKTVKSDPAKQRLYNALPGVEFTRGKAIQIGKRLGIAERTIDKYLREYTGGRLLANDSYGKYKKP